MLDSFLRNVTKDSYGPISFQVSGKPSTPAVIHKFHDSFSILNWGKLPEPLLNRGKAQSLVFAQLNTLYQSPEQWAKFQRSPDALSFRKAGASIQNGGSVSSMLNELANHFPLPSNYLGVVDENTFKNLDGKTAITGTQLVKPEFTRFGTGALPSYYPLCEFYQEEKIPHANVMGRTVSDYSIWKKQNGIRVLPFEFICHFKLTESSLSSLRPEYVSIPKTSALHTLKAGTSWDFPLIELALSQDPRKQRIGAAEAIWITEWKPEQLQKVMLSAAWISAFTRSVILERGLELNSIQLKFAVNSMNEVILLDAFCMDDLRLEKDSHELHIDHAIQFYQKSSWFDAVLHAQKQAEHQGVYDWKRLCVEPAPFMDPKFKQQLEGDQELIARHLLGK